MPTMKRSGTARPIRKEPAVVIERDGKWFIAHSPEVPGANGQGRTKAAARKSLADAIALILDSELTTDLPR